MDYSEIADKLLEHPQFVLLLRETVGGMVEETQIERRQANDTPEVNSLLQELYEMIRQAVEMTLQANTHSFTQSLMEAVTRMKLELERQMASFQQTLRSELAETQTDCRKALKTIKSQLLQDRLRVQKKITSAKQNIQSLNSKLRSVEQAQTHLIDLSQISQSFNQKSLSETTTILSDQRADEINRKVASLQDSISTTENQIQDRYQATIRGLWNVVTDLSGRLLVCEGRFEEQPKQKREGGKQIRKSMWAFR